MKRTKAAVPASETGRVPGDYTGSRPFMQMPTKGGRNATTDEARRSAGGVAPRPQNSKQPYVGSSADTAGIVASMARVPNSPSSPTGKMTTAGSFTPVQNNALANLTGQSTGQNEVLPRGNSARISPQTRTPITNHPVATAKPKRKGLGSAFFGEY